MEENNTCRMETKNIISRIGVLVIASLCYISTSAQSTNTDSIGKTGELEMPFTLIEHHASFPGGQGKLMPWLAKNIQYTEEMKESLQGRVLVTFYVEADGTINDVNVERSYVNEDGTSSTVIVEQSAMSALDKEVVRVVKAMPKWEPATQNGEPVREKYILPLNIDPQ